jgi:PAS domain S-box-containing protein
MISILLIDNDPSLLHLCKTYLERSCDLRVDFALSVRDADDKLAEKVFDAIVCEHQLPWRTGLEFLKRLRLKNDPIPFIMFTDYGSEDIVIEALNAGADYYVRKGGDPKSKFAELEHMVRDSVHRRWHDEAQRLRNAAFDASAVAYVITDPEFIIKEANEAFARAWNLERRDQALNANLKGYLLSGEVVGVIKTSIEFIGKWEGEFTAKRQDDSTFVTYCQASPLHNPAGDLTGYFLTILATPKRMSSENAPTIGDARFRALADTSSEWLSIIDQNGDIVHSTPSSFDVSGYRSSDLQGRKFGDFVVAAHFERFAIEMRTASEEDEVHRFESSIRHHEGTSIPAIIELSRFREGEGTTLVIAKVQRHSPVEVASVLGTEVKETSEAVPVPEVVPAPAPVALVVPMPIQTTNTIEAEPVIAPSIVDQSTIVTRKDDLERLELLQDMLEVESLLANEASKPRFEEMEALLATVIAHAKFAEEYEAIGSEPVWQSVYQSFQRAVSGSSLERAYVMNLTNKLEVLADPLLEKAFRNLLDFTIKNDGDAHKIWMTYEVEQEGVRIIYEDNGTGIAPELKASLFREGQDRYHGLCIAQHILRTTGVEIVESGDPNKGIRFEMFVPLDRYRIEEVPASGEKVRSPPGEQRSVTATG